MIQTMVRAKYDSDPVKAWKEAQKKIMVCVMIKVYFYIVVVVVVVPSSRGPAYSGPIH